MPNWCHNRVTISTTGEDTTQFKELIKKFQSETPFQAIKPQPDWPNTPNSAGELPVKREERHANGEIFYTTYDFPDGKNDDRWYDWANNEWGTKWDASDFSTDDLDEECGYVEFSFHTAWGPATGIYEEIVENYEDVNVSWFYDEPGMECAGYLPN